MVVHCKSFIYVWTSLVYPQVLLHFASHSCFFLGLIWKPDCRWRWMFYHCQGPKSCLPMKKEARKSIHVFTKQSNIWALLSYAVHEFGTTFKALNMNLGVYSFWSAFSHISRSKVNLIAQFLKGDANLSSCRVMPTLYWSSWAGLMGCFLAFYLSSLRAESARAFTGRRNSHSGKGEDFLSRQQDFFTETAVTPEQKVKKSFPRWEINRHVEG